ncbi:MAG: cytochrome c biogenesis protein ResB, partial [Desulfocapsa sp.]|nr:cytochrome c biogenesis protein ResB [Desulfocapsa sp.]
VPAISVFTPVFVDAITYGRGDLNKDGYISGTELGLYLQQEVPRHISQTPQYGKISDYLLSRGDFIFLVNGRLAGVSSSELSSSQPAYRINAEEEMWVAVRESSDLSDLEMYLAEYPDGRFSTVASLKIRKIDGGAVTPSSLTVKAKPSGALVRILNTVPKYEPEMALDPGGYRVEVSCFGYETVILDIELAAGENLTIPVSLQKDAILVPKSNPNVMIPEGKSTDVFYLSSASGQTEKIPLGFTIRCDMAKMEFDEDGTPLHIKSELVLLQKKNEILRKSLKAAGHFSYKGFSFQLTNYQSYKDVKIRIKNTMTGGQKTFITEFQQQTVWSEEGLSFGIINVELVKLNDESAQNVINRLKVWFSDKEEQASVFWIKPNEENVIKTQGGDYIFSARQHFGIGLTRIPEKL